MTQDDLMNSLRGIIVGSDKYGNEYMIDLKNYVYLKPSYSTIARQIGLVQIKGETIQYLKYETEKDRFRKTDAWSINWHVGRHVHVIYFKTRIDTYKISIKDALQDGEFLHFESSTEKKLYVPIKFWTKKSEVKCY